jgi:TonB family protein
MTRICWTLALSVLPLLAWAQPADPPAAPASANAKAGEAPPPADAAAPGSEKGPEIVPPKLTKFVEAVYPPEAFKAGKGAVVVMQLTIDVEGAVEEATITQSGGAEFDTAATDAAMQFEFTPALIDKKPEAVQILYRYVFEVKQESTEKVVEVDKEKPTGDLGGKLLEKGTRKPLVGITVRLADGTEAYSDAKGEFRLEKLPVGNTVITIEDDAFYTLEDEEEVVAGKLTELTYYLERRGANDDSVTVVGRRVKKEVARRTLTMEEIRKIPGTQGDALKVVQNLPGVARIPFGGGGLIVRGSNPGDSGSFINRHFVPIIFHFGGIRSVFPSELLESIDFYPGNFGAEFGRLTGGVVDARIRRPKDDRLHGRVEADIFDAGFLLEGPLHEGATFALAGRRSYIDAILPFVLPDDANVDFAVAPRYYDYQALYDLKTGKHRVRAYFFGSDDALQFLIDQPVDIDPSIRGTFRNETSFFRAYLAWNAKLSDDVDHEFSVATGKNRLFFAGGPDLFFEIDTLITTVREEIEMRWGKQFKLRVGLDVETALGDIEIRAPQPPKEGEQPPPLSTREILRIDQPFTFIDPSPWIEGQLKFGDLLLVPGLRVDYNYTLDDYRVDPRLAVRYDVAKDAEKRPTTTLKAAAGLYSQRPSPDESDETFGNPDIELEGSVHLAAGFEQRLFGATELDVQGFYKHLYNSVSPVEDPRQRFGNDGEGRIYGMELLLRHKTPRFFGWISYTLMRSERKDAGDDEYRLFSFDQTHILTAIANYKLTNTWEVGARYRYVTGNPQTPRNGAVYAVDTDVYVPYLGATNSTRLPAFNQLDIRVDRRWLFDTWILTAYLEIQNVFNRANSENLTYDFDSTDTQAVTGLPIIPSLGIRGEF